MEYKIYPPNEILAKKVKYYWSLEDFEAKNKHTKERVFPDGCIELLFHYGELFNKTEKNGSITTQPKSLIHGQITKFIEIEAIGKIGIFSARFKPNGLYGFVDFDISKITDKTISVYEIWGNDGTVLEKNIIEAASNEERVLLLEAFLEKKLNTIKKYDATIDNCVEAIMKLNGIITVDEITKKLSISKKQLERKFQSSVGLNLKMFSRITRFNYALQLIEKKEFDSFTKVAYDGGFYDQAHFIKDFKDITGLNPKQYFSENLEMVKFFNL